MRTPIAKIVLLPVFMFAFFVAYTHSLPFAQSILPAASDVGLGWFIAAVVVLSVVLAGLWGLVFALPLAWLYQRHAVFAAILCVVPVLLVVGQHFGRSASLLAHVPVVAFFVSLAVLVPVVAQFTHRLLRRNEQPA